MVSCGVGYSPGFAPWTVSYVVTSSTFITLFLFLLGVIKMTKFIIILVVFFSVLFCGINSLMQAAKAENLIKSRNDKIECIVDGNCK